MDEGETCAHPRPHLADEEILRHKSYMFSTGFQAPGVKSPKSFFLLKGTRIGKEICPANNGRDPMMF